MPRGKIAMRLVENARARAATCGRRTRGLQNKAKELATLCAVPVALVCFAAGAGAQPLVWESEERVLDRYRRAVPPEARAQHTHRGYLEAELGKERAKLARVRHGCPAALADWDPALNDVTLAEARELLDAIDAALRAARDRMEALGLPADGGHGPLDEQIAPDASDDAVMPQQLAHGGGVPCTGSNPVDMDAAGFELQMVPWHGGNNDGLLGEDRFQMQAGCGFQCIGGGNYSGTVDETLAPGSGNADYDWPDLTMWHTDELRDAVLPLGHYPAFADGTLAPKYSAQVAAGGDYMNMKTLPTGYGYPMAMDVGDNFTNLGGNYTAHWQAEESHRSGTSTSQLMSTASLPQCSDPRTRSSSQAFHYLN